MDKKKLLVNSAMCDTRTVTEEILNAYESIAINAATILVSQESKELLSRYHVTINVAETIELSDDAEVVVHNGTYEISEGTIMAKPTVLIINGSLQIKKGSEKALETFASIHVNGSVTYPSNLQNQLPPLKVNGSTNTYPSDAILLKNKIIVDKIFILRAKDSKYYIKNKVIIADETLDISLLLTKGSSFITKNALIAESCLENAVALFDDNTNIDIIPRGYKYVQGGRLDNQMINKNGDKLYVDGDLIITSDSESALRKLSSLWVSGSILITSILKDIFLNLDAEYNDLKIIKGNIMVDKGILKINKELLAGEDDGITILDCGAIQIDKDITPSEIEEKLQFIDCGIIACYPEQRAAIELVSEDVGLINDNDLSGFDVMGEDNDSPNLYQKDTQVINAATYNM